MTQVIVGAKDPAFGHPTKFMGAIWSKPEAEAMANDRGWQIAQDGNHWRRVVPSPIPLSIPDTKVIAILLKAGALVICGGGIPVIKHPDGSLSGIEAVVDKDRASVLLARQTKADALLLLIDVATVYEDFGTDHQKPIHQITATASPPP